MTREKNGYGGGVEFKDEKKRVGNESRLDRNDDDRRPTTDQEMQGPEPDVKEYYRRLVSPSSASSCVKRDSVHQLRSALSAALGAGRRPTQHKAAAASEEASTSTGGGGATTSRELTTGK